MDDWGLGFVDELDYRREAANAERFNEAIARTPLGGAVFAPPVVGGASGRKVLTTGWVDGERLESSGAADVAKLCSLCMNTYLTMLLETGTLVGADGAGLGCCAACNATVLPAAAALLSAVASPAEGAGAPEAQQPPHSSSPPPLALIAPTRRSCPPLLRPSASLAQHCDPHPGEQNLRGG